MPPIRLLYAENVVSRRGARAVQHLEFRMLVENIAYDKLVEVVWSDDDLTWRTSQAQFHGTAGRGLEIWRVHVRRGLGGPVTLPGDIQFALHFRVQGSDYWDNNLGTNHRINESSGVLLCEDLSLLNLGFDGGLRAGRSLHPVEVAVRRAIAPTRVVVHWSTDRWKTVRTTPCLLRQDRGNRKESQTPKKLEEPDCEIWQSQVPLGDAFQVEYAISCETESGVFWDNNFGENYLARHERLKVLTLNLHCYQEENQDEKLSRIAKAIDDLGADIVCLQEVGEHWNEGRGSWNSNTAKIIRDRLRRSYDLHTDRSHIGFDRFYEGSAILSRHGFMLQDSGYVSSGTSLHDINARKIVMGQVLVPHFGVLNVFSIHLSWWSGGFSEQFSRLHSWATVKHMDGVAGTLFCGDFNVTQDSEGYRAVVETRDYVDLLTLAEGSDCAGNGWTRRDRTVASDQGDDRRIDYVFLRSDCRLRVARSGPLFTDRDLYGPVSDHPGYYVELEPSW